MPVNIVVESSRGLRPVTRHAMVMVPPGWQKFLQDALDNGQGGLPILLAFHGGGQDPEAFARGWNFRRCWERLNGQYRAWWNQFILVYPQGWSLQETARLDETLFGPTPLPPGTPAWITDQLRNPVAPQLSVPPAAGSSLERTIDQINRGLAYAGDVAPLPPRLPNPTGNPAVDQVNAYLTYAAEQPSLDALVRAMPGQPNAIWNPGRFMPNDDPQDDVEFIRTLLARIESRLLEDCGIPGLMQVIDPKRRYLFGYSMGGMLCYRLIKEMPDTWAAYHSMCSTIGGRLFSDDRDNMASFTDNDPGVQTPVSLYAHVGGQELRQPINQSREEHLEWNDLAVPPGSPNDLPGTENQPPAKVEELVGDQVMSELAARNFVQKYLSLTTAVPKFLAMHPYGPPTVLSNQPDRTTDMTLPSPRGTATITTHRPANGRRNPEVVEHRDERMNHTNYGTGRNQYITVDSVWDWLYAHPQV